MTRCEIEPRKKVELDKQSEGEKTYSCKYYVPDVDIWEMGESIVMEVDLPGVRKENIDINVKEDVLTVEGRVDPGEYEGLEPTYSEYNVGHYYRQFTLGKLIDQNKIEAEMDRGTLKLVLPKMEKALPRQISIK